jgi:hypothetical protein
MSKFRGLEVCQTVNRRDYMYRLLSKANQPEYFHQAAETLALMEKLGDVAQLVQSGAFDDIAKGAARAMVASHQYSGFGYAQYKHAEENNSNLGRCVVQPRWVFDFVERFKELKLQIYLKQGWCGRQDVYLLSASP